MSQEPSSYTEFVHRVGTFLLMIGVVLVILFILSDAAQQTTFSYFCWGIILLFVGFAFRRQHKKSAPSSGRFSIFKKLKPKPKEKK